MYELQQQLKTATQVITDKFPSIYTNIQIPRTICYSTSILCLFYVELFEFYRPILRQKLHASVFVDHTQKLQRACFDRYMPIRY